MTLPYIENTTLLLSANTTPANIVYEERESLNVIIPLSVSYGIIFIAGILGNLSTCVVIARNRSMHTATNFYLISLALSDLVLLLSGLPFEVHRLWNPNTYPLDEASCIALGLASETSANATVLTITAFTVERYIAICRPFMSHTMSKLSRAVRFIIAIWVFAICTALPQAVQFGILRHGEGLEEVSACTVIGQGVHQVFVISSCIFFVVPMSVITVLYALIGIKLRTSRVLHPKKPSVESNGRSSGSTRCKNGASQRRVIRMLVAVALSFFVCWAPFHVQRLLAIYGKNLDEPSIIFYQVYMVLTYLSGVLYFLSTAINPILYNVMSNKFRDAFRTTLAVWCGRRPPSRMARTYSALNGSQRLLRAGGTAPGAGNIPMPGRLRRLSTATSQLGDLPPRAQSMNGRGLYALTESPAVSDASEGSQGRSWCMARRFRLTRTPREQVSDSAGSPRSISNSSLREVDDELTGEELATYMYQVNRNIGGYHT